MQLPNLLASKWGRLIAFFCLYVTEGIPLGFTATAIATQLRRSGVGPKEIGFFVGWLYFPWAWKWVMGPVVDLFYSNKLGARRGWIIGMQVMMVATLMFCVPLELNESNLTLLTSIILIHNFFCATQDVAIDALACNTLQPEERGLANGLMFAGQTLGIPLGGACVLYLIDGVSWLPLLQDGIPFEQTYFFVAACILAVTILVAIPMREKPLIRKASEGDRAAEMKKELVDYLTTAWRSFFGSRVAFAALILAVIPAGAAALNLALQKTLAVELGMTDGEVADLEVVSSVIWAVCCVAGGMISDRVGHLKSLAVFLVLMSIPTLWLGFEMERQGYIMPVEIAQAESGSEGENPPNVSAEPSGDAEAPANEVSEEVIAKTESKGSSNELKSAKDGSAAAFSRNVPAGLVDSFWWAVMFYMAAQGLMYGTRTAVFMQISNPAVAATQFTAYMAMMNLVTAYTSWWQGVVIEEYGYPVTLFIDASTGLICLAVLPFLFQKAVAASSASIPAPRD
ncbi:MAG: MFS transporter [Planctomycetota bacterium]|nr:MFS transporter [Planctomycetota bacterium]MDA0919436.1 MFS transporter [Planctomycetota bacterium]